MPTPSETSAPGHMYGSFLAHEPEDCPGLPLCPDGTAIHALADVEEGAVVMGGARVWRWSLVRAGAVIGFGCSIGSHVIIGPGVTLGAGCRVQDGAKLYGPLRLGERVFVGPHAVFCNDRHPRVRAEGWRPTDGETVVEDSASIGAGAVVMPGVRIGAGAMVGAGAVVLQDVPAGAVWVGAPAREAVCVSS